MRHDKPQRETNNATNKSFNNRAQDRNHQFVPNIKPSQSSNQTSMNNLKDIPLPKQFNQLSLTNQLKSNEVPMALPKKQNDDPENSADALKKLLRIGSVDATPQTSLQAIDLKTLFGKTENPLAELDQNGFCNVNVANLPKPPANWQKKATKDTAPEQKAPPIRMQAQQQPQQLNIQHGPQPQSCINMPQPFPNHFNQPQMCPQFPPNVVRMPIAMAHPFVHAHPQFPPMIIPHPIPAHIYPPPFIQPNHRIRLNGPIVANFNYPNQQQMLHKEPVSVNAMQPMKPKGPQNLIANSENNKSTSHASAFIPLQAIRKTVKGKSTQINAPEQSTSVADLPPAPAQTKQNNARAVRDFNEIKVGKASGVKVEKVRKDDAIKVTATSSNKNTKFTTESVVNPKLTTEMVLNDKKNDAKKVIITEKPAATPPKRLACNFSVSPAVNKPKTK